jgi:hypothetical protein
LCPAAGQGELVAEWLPRLEAWVRGSGLELRYQSPAVNTVVDGATNGTVIWIRPDLAPAERLIVLAHEIAHAKMHFRRKQRGAAVLIDEPGALRSRDTRELEAELTAFLILALSGIDAAEGSAVYLNSWRASRKSIRAHAARAFLVACSVLRDCEKRRYRNLLGQGPASVCNELRAAL